MISNVEGGEEERQDEKEEQHQNYTTFEQELEAELNAMPNFLEMTKEEIIDWINS